MPITLVSTPNAPTPAGHYSQATVHQGVVYVAGQLPIDPKTGAKLLGSVEEQAERTLRNVEAILVAAGSDLSQLLMVTIYVSDIEYWGAINAVYTRILGAHRPARAVVPTKELHYGFALEIAAIGALKAPKK
jgi:2-iminobutanoate/2-iminopropanoate deaminase